MYRIDTLQKEGYIMLDKKNTETRVYIVNKK